MIVTQLITLLACFSLASAQGVPVPPAGKVYIGTWLDTADTPSTNTIGDRPVAFDQRMGFYASAFQYAQNMPLSPYAAPDEQIKATGTDAFMYLTVYARPNPWEVTDADIQVLVNQCRRLNNDEKINLLIRFSPEMNGDWNFWGGQPVKYKQLWIRVYTAVKAACPYTSFVWGPSEGLGYPFSIRTPTDAAELAALDTNNNGVVDAGDDPYSPYYPGDQYVDWVGLSIYHYGDAYPWEENVSAAPGKFDSMLNAVNFYQQYSVAKNKPFVVNEGASSFHTDIPVGVGELEVKRSFWRQWLTNETLFSAYPNIKMFNLFEFRKDEETTNRDFRISTTESIRNAFLADFAAVKSHYLFANSSTSTTPPSNGGSPVGNNLPANGFIAQPLIPVIIALAAGLILLF